MSSFYMPCMKNQISACTFFSGSLLIVPVIGNLICMEDKELVLAGISIPMPDDHSGQIVPLQANVSKLVRINKASVKPCGFPTRW